MIVDVVGKLLLQSSAITNLVGDSVHWHVIDEGAGYPALIVSQLSGNSLEELDGLPGDDEGRVQVDCWAKAGDVMSLAVCKQIGDAVRGVIEGYQGDAESRYICGCTMERDNTFADKPDPGSREYQWRRSLDFRLTYTNNLARV